MARCANESHGGAVVNKNEGEKQMTQQPTRPAFEARLNHLRATVWENRKDGATWYTVNVTRRYRDGEQWKDAHSLNGLADIVLAREALQLAADFIRSRATTEPATEDEWQP
jgi:hypothetical protein